MTEHPCIPDQRRSTAEHHRLADSPAQGDAWRLWGPYVAARQWGTVREDYSADGDAWSYFPFDHAHQRAYRWGEDGLAAVCDRFGFLNLGVALWNGRDDRLKERLFGLSGPQGNHGEDVKEYWWAQDATPTHSWSSYLYRYPQAAFPYEQLRHENATAGLESDEIELADTGVLAEDRFFDVEVQHAKASENDLLLRIVVTNHGPDVAPVHVLPQLWFRNTWSWGRDDRRPHLQRVGQDDQEPVRSSRVRARHAWLGTYEATAVDGDGGAPRQLVFCENETDEVAVFGVEQQGSPYPKNVVDRVVVHQEDAANPAQEGTKCAWHFVFEAVEPGASVSVDVRLAGMAPADVADGSAVAEHSQPAGVAPMPSAWGEDREVMLDGLEEVIAARRAEADAFYDEVIPADVDDERRHVARRAFAGLMWAKQLYRYSVAEWLEGDPASPPPPAERRERPEGRNTDWSHLDLADVISMPDEWEYPWFATWDTAFHTVAMAHVDPEFAKCQLVLMVREWAQHPNGQLPAYEWDFGDVNPPVHAWACWQVYRLDGARDRGFLVTIFTKLMMNFQWWVNRKDPEGSFLFTGGFMGMDNIAFFDRSATPDQVRLEQSDATSWMAFFSLSMLRVALELSREDDAWDGACTTFFEYFLRIDDAMESPGSGGVTLWNAEDGFFYDSLVQPDGTAEQLKVRSTVGLLPLMAVGIIPSWVWSEVRGFHNEVDWLQHRRPHLTKGLVVRETEGDRSAVLQLVGAERRGRILSRMLDEGEFLSPYGLRSLSAAHRDGVSATLAGRSFELHYVAGVSDSHMFGGNSNWRGPVWFPTNLLLVDALAVTAEGDPSATAEFPTGSGVQVPLGEIAQDLRNRLVGLFLPGEDGRRPGTPRHHPGGPLWDVHPTFSEYFDGDLGVGLGASHQCGWTGMVAHLICADRPHP
ncbi:MGH1-like glycoside hydrolase domain-containing protein [Kytococcus sp. Marseille-QA3725]